MTYDPVVTAAVRIGDDATLTLLRMPVSELVYCYLGVGIYAEPQTQITPEARPDLRITLAGRSIEPEEER